ncbi:16S rRNA (cytidine(1402)-2'-O)-methyltransferase [Candidatus Peregrinibacteria bacterium HGW-Peregrinibacteria-1]|jgi:16S rRNA (cytidine1402-2'-O)-methyltransferase|nr:MAG: 16S rRNA (cytidine(1402)-2'-O)-methyltransferase [Candidatus Peregrinibacteria bacterium HGW-Peregrinibacteria-1]
MLYIVSTPIGNLKDITIRALDTLQEVDYIAAEDTRHTGKLLKHYEIDKPLLSYHSHSGFAKIEKIIQLLKEGKKIAVVSDAGTPGISDPAYSLIQEAIKEQISIIPIPGASSLLAAIVASGMPMNQFLYLGFLPLKKGRQTILKSLVDETRTVVIFESPHRIVKTLTQLHEYLGDRQVALCRELTKIYEEVLRAPLSTHITYYKTTSPKGEYVLVIAPDNFRARYENPQAH